MFQTKRGIVVIKKITLLKNIGKFDDASFPNGQSFSSCSFIYGENGKGKTTIAAVLRSLALNDPAFVLERHRLGATDPPYIVIEHSNGKSVFEDKKWNNPIKKIEIFDDTFISNNVCSGSEVLSSHRQHLHELILGAEGVSLSLELDAYKEKIDLQKSSLKEVADSIPTEVLGTYGVDNFCKIKRDSKIDAKIQEAEERLSVAKSKDEIRSASIFLKFELPNFDIDEIDQILKQDLPKVEMRVTKLVSRHISNLGEGGETWVSDGLTHISNISKNTSKEICPLCAQDIDQLEIIKQYRDYFSKAYKSLKQEIAAMESKIKSCHDEKNRSEFEFRIKNLMQVYEFWKKFVTLPAVDLDVDSIISEWATTYQSILDSLKKKSGSPLERMKLNPNTIKEIRNYQKRVREVETVWKRFEHVNRKIESIKQDGDSDDVLKLETNLKQLNAQKARFHDDIAPICDKYVKIESEVKRMERDRNAKRSKLSEYRDIVFPKYKKSINLYLKKFGASFEIGEVSSHGHRGGTSVLYHVVINNKNVNLVSDEGPSFRNTLSAGDRSNLALAFFLTSLDQDKNLDKKIVVFDDPMTSLDSHRSNCTRQEIIALRKKVKQVIILSHSMHFLCQLQSVLKRRKVTTSAFRIQRKCSGSQLVVQNPDQFCTTEYDKSHEAIRNYLCSGDDDTKCKVAISLRLLLESFLRVACPEHFPPGEMIGSFLTTCRKHARGRKPILSKSDISELGELVDYANRFHHDTGAEFQGDDINDSELCAFAERVLAFTSKSVNLANDS